MLLFLLDDDDTGLLLLLSLLAVLRNRTRGREPPFSLTHTTHTREEERRARVVFCEKKMGITV